MGKSNFFKKKFNNIDHRPKVFIHFDKSKKCFKLFKNYEFVTIDVQIIKNM